MRQLLEASHAVASRCIHLHGGRGVSLEKRYKGEAMHIITY
jgi:hypothetical protein